MVWARLDDRANSSAKLIALTDAAFRLWACGLIYCQANLTDGHIPEHAINTFGLRSAKPPKAALELTQALVPGKGPLWHVEPGGYVVHDYLDWNVSRADIFVERARAAARKADWKNRRRDSSGTRSEHVSEQVPERVPKSVQNKRSTTTTSTDPDRDHPDQQPQDQNQPAGPVHAVLVKLAHTVLDDIDAGSLDIGAKDALKDRAAQARLAYDAGAITKALDSAEAQRGLQRAVLRASGRRSRA